MIENGLRTAIPALIICVSVAPAQDIASLLEDGKNKATRKQFAAALTPLTSVVTKAPKNAEARRWRGHCLTALGRYERALEDLDIAVKLDAKNAWALYARGMAKHHLERHREAIADYTASLALDPANHKAVEWRGFNKSRIGDHLGAYLDFTRATVLDPENPWVWSARARAATNLGAFDHAAKDVAKAIGLSPKDAGLHAQLGFVRVAAGETKAALESFDKCFALAPHHHPYARLFRYWLKVRGRKLNESDGDSLPKKGWEGDLARVLLGEITNSRLLLRLSAYGLEARELPARRCEAAFYTGMRWLITGKVNRARESFRDAIVAGDASMPEWHAARILAKRRK